MKLLRLALLATLLFSFNNLGAQTLNESPANITQGQGVKATWSGITNPSSKDWIGLYAAGAGDGSFQTWIYVSCSQSATVARASGTCLGGLIIPNATGNGTYELRLFSNDGFSRLATSNTFNIGSVAQPSTRFVDNGDGTISDSQTGLMWEKKDAGFGEPSSPVQCFTLSDCPSSHLVNNTYRWTSSGTAPDGLLFTNFLKRSTTEFSTSTNSSFIPDVCYVGYCDWRIPNIAELRTILLANCPGGASPCTDPIFGPTATNTNRYWSSTTDQSVPSFAWSVNFSDGTVQSQNKSGPNYARVVRGYR